MSIFDMKLFRFLGFKRTPKAPWKKYYSDEAMECEIPDLTMYKYYKKCSKNYSDLTAISYFGKDITYSDFNSDINISIILYIWFISFIGFIWYFWNCNISSICITFSS